MFSESTPNAVGTQSNGFVGTEASDNADLKSSHDDGSKPSSDDGKKVDEDTRKDSECNDQEKEDNVNNTNNVNVASTNEVNDVDDEDDGVVADMNNLDTTIQVNPNLTTRIHKDHPLDQVIGDLQSPTQTRKMSKNLNEHGKNPKRNKKDERGIVIRNKARLVAQGYTQEEGIHYDEVFSPVANIEAIRLFLAYASFKDFVVYQMDVKSAFLYGKIEEEVYVCQPPRFKDPNFPVKVYKVEKALYGLHQAPKAWYETLSTYLLDNGFQRGKIDKTLFIKRHKGDILLVQVYVDDIIFGSTKKELCNAFEKFTKVKTASTPMETQKPLLKDEDGEEVDVHMYRSMIGSLMYLTSSRPDIMFAVCACARYQVNPKVSHLHAVKRIFRYLKGQPKLGLWYPKDSPFDLVAYTDSDYAGASLDRKSTTGGCQFLGCRLISWQCKKQTVVANSTTEAEYVAASSCCGQVLWIQNQLLDYGYNFMHTKIFIDNNRMKEVGKSHSFPILDSLGIGMRSSLSNSLFGIKLRSSSPILKESSRLLFGKMCEIAPMEATLGTQRRAFACSKVIRVDCIDGKALTLCIRRMDKVDTAPKSARGLGIFKLTKITRDENLSGILKHLLGKLFGMSALEPYLGHAVLLIQKVHFSSYRGGGNWWPPVSLHSLLFVGIYLDLYRLPGACVIGGLIKLEALLCLSRPTVRSMV
ncbi:putative ribonuclease H-like domain-containing protein [Tanacetum coccineum]